MGDDERLIEDVRVFECLWKVNAKAYKICVQRKMPGKMSPRR